MDEKMTEIEWENIYYMLIYALDEFPYLSNAIVSFENINSTPDLLGTLLDSAFEIIYSQQILRQYSVKNVDTGRPRGRINIERSYQLGVIGKGKLNCDISVFNIDNIYNQAIKAGFLALLGYGADSTLSDSVRLKLIQDLHLLSGVTKKPLTLGLIQEASQVPPWYLCMRAVLQMIYENYLASDKRGEKHLYELTDKERLCWIFEKFVRNYCKKIFEVNNSLLTISQPKYYEARGRGIPRKCELDLLLEGKFSALIVDMKWYENPQERGCADNMRQIKEYMQGYQQKKYGRGYDMTNVNGLLLYADTETGDPDWELSHYDDNADDSKIYWQTIGLNQKWESLKRDLDRILIEKLNLEAREKLLLKSLDDSKVVHIRIVGSGFESIRHAEGLFDFSTNNFLLFEGAELFTLESRDDYVRWNKRNHRQDKTIYSRYESAVEAGEIVNGVTTKDLEFDSPWIPCSWYMGYSVDGFEQCITDDGKFLSQMRSELQGIR